MNQIILYGKENCRQCDFTKKFLDKEKLVYEYIDTTNDEKTIKYIKEELGFSSLPVVKSGEVVFSGYRPTELKKLVKKV